MDHSSAVFSDQRDPCAMNFNSIKIMIIPVDIILVKSYAESFLDSMELPVRVSVSLVLGNGKGLTTGKLYPCCPLLSLSPAQISLIH